MNNFAVHCLLAQVLGGFEPPIPCLLDRRVKCWVTRIVAFNISIQSYVFLFQARMPFEIG